MTTMRRILLVFVICVLAVAYLYQHSCSVKLTRNLSRLETERKLLAERLEGVGAEIVTLSGFARMESLWVAQGRPAVPADQIVTANGQVVAMAKHPGADAAAR
jgi:hypothetical protein